MKEVRWGLTGAGDVCEKKSGPPLYQLPGSRLVFINRRDAAKGRDFAKRHGPGEYIESYSEMLESPLIDAVYVATPHDCHKEQTIAALEAGKHVLVEKPMALTAEECSAMTAAAARNRKSLGVAYYRRGYPSIQRIRELMRDDVIGDITKLSINNEFPTSHRLDLAHYILGDIHRVRLIPEGSDPFIPERTTVAIAGETRDGVQVQMTMGYKETGMPESLFLQGTQGSIFLADLKGGIILLRSQDKEQPETILTGGLPWTHWGLMENFVAHLREGSPLLCDGVEGRKSTVILDTLFDAPGTGDWKTVEY